MANLSELTQKKQSKLFDGMGAFFAFSDKQFNEAKKEGVKYVSMGTGLICPKENVEALRTGLNLIHTKGVKKRLKLFGLDKIIEYELANYESYYTYSINDAFEVCKEYGATEEDMWRVFNANKEKYD